MPYSFDDFLATHNSGREIITGEAASVLDYTEAAVAKLFPEVNLTPSEYVRYVPLRLCTSLPNVNQRGRCFTGKVLNKSFGTIVHNMLNIDHLVAHNGLSANDHIAGSIQAAKFIHPEITAGEAVSVDGEVATIPAVPAPVMALAALWLRAKNVKAIVDNHMKGKEIWSVSMECGHRWQDAAFLYENEFIPAPDAPSGMLECVTQNSVANFKGKPLSVALGGIDGKVDFWGAGLTRQPADETSKVYQFIGAPVREMANTKKTFFMPMKLYEGDEYSKEVASIAERCEEIASIGILGETEEADGHSHVVLTDMTIMPAMGHDHCMKTMVIDPGTKPKLTGVTNSQYTYVNGSDTRPSESIVHLHTVNIDLSKKYKAAVNADTTGNGSPSATITLDSETANLGDLEDMKRTIGEIQKDLTKISGEIASAKTDAERQAFLTNFTAVNKELADLSSEAAIDAKVAERVEALKTAGTLLSKEDADAKVVAAKKELEEAAAKKEAEAKKRQERNDKLIAAGVDASYGLPGMINADQTPMTIKNVVESLPLDESGDTQFTINLASWKSQRDAAKELADSKAKNETVVAEAANKGGAGSGDATPPKVSKSIILTAGGGAAGGAGGNGHSNEVANTGTRRQANAKGKSHFLAK